MSDRVSVQRREALAVAALTLLPLLPFLGKAYSVDAPVFVAVAEQIVAAPLDPFGFQMFWDVTSLEAAEFNRNPPLFSYWLAPWLALSGGQEWVLRLAALAFPLLAALAFLGIARRLTPDAPGAAGLLVTTPAFVVLASTLLLDVPTLACLLLAVYALLRGVEAGGEAWLWGAGLAAVAAGLMKYAGLAAVALVAAGAWLLAARRASALGRVLAGPAVVLAGWAAFTAARYGSVHFLGSSDVVLGRSFLAPLLLGQLTAIPIYYGAALVFPVVLCLRCAGQGGRGSTLAVAALVLGAAVATWVLPWGLPARRHPPGLEQMLLAVLGFGGGLFVWLALLDPRRGWQDPTDRFLGLWLVGWLVFSGLVNWHVNAADALLAAPPALLLIFRHERLRPERRFARGLAASTLALSLLLAWADAQQANFHREVAAELEAAIGKQSGQRWFVGNWGFQHYLEDRGFRPVLPLELGGPELAVGDWLAAPRNVAQQEVAAFQHRYRLEHAGTWENRTWLPLRTTNGDAGAGFYSHRYGYTPFGWNTGPVEVVQLGRVVSVSE